MKLNSGRIADRTVEVIKLLLILLFVYAAVSKLMVYDKFVVQIGLSPLLPPFFKSIAWLIPVIELAVSLSLIFPSTVRAGLYASFVLMLSFTFYIAGILTIAAHVPCSCGGALEMLSWEEHLVLNMIYLILSVIGIVLHERTLRSLNDKAPLFL